MRKNVQSALDALGVVIGAIITSEIAIFIARWAWDTFGAVSVILTFALWATFPIWWIWRSFLGIFT